METTLNEFIRALRTAGAQVSSAEAIDAARTLALIGYDDRQRMKDALNVVLAKSEEEKDIHDKLFEMFFTRKSAPRRDASSNDKKDGKQDKNSPSRSQDMQQQGGGGAPQQAGGAPGQGGGGGGEPSFMALTQSQDPDEVAVALERAADAVEVDDIRFASQTAYYVRRIMERLGVDEFERELARLLDDPSRKAQRRAAELAAARTALQRQARALVDQRFELFGRAAQEAFMNEVTVNREIGQLAVGDMDRIKAIVARMAKRLAVRHSRRRKQVQRGMLDTRKTMRANAGNDGVPFNLVWKTKRKDRPKIVTICDVSGSVARYVRFLLLFLHTLKDEVTDLSAYAFSAHLKEVGQTLESLSFEKAMDRIVMEAGGGSTDYGQALADFEREHMDVIDRRTTVLVLGDGRSNQTDPRIDIFQEIADRAKRVVWLCPEPPRRWGTGDSAVLRYQPFCTQLLYCASAADLERAIDDVLTAYD